MSSKIVEIYGRPTSSDCAWDRVFESESCPYLGRKCLKNRKSEASLTIGTCTVLHRERPIIICPHRLLSGKKIFRDALHLLTNHEPGNDYHLIPEVTTAGGNVDYFVVSAKNGKVEDFVGIELQTMDSTGSIWPERLRLENQLTSKENVLPPNKAFGINWKMTAKTILVQMHHKISLFEQVNKRLLLIVQDELLEYMQSNFDFSQFNYPARMGDSFHLHSYTMMREGILDEISLESRISTDSQGLMSALGLNTDIQSDIESLIERLETKLTPETIFPVFQ